MLLENLDAKVKVFLQTQLFSFHFKLLQETILNKVNFLFFRWAA